MSAPLALDPIKARIAARAQADTAREWHAATDSLADVDAPALVAEVDRLRAALSKIEDLVSDIRFAHSKPFEHRALMALESFVQDAIRGVS